MKEEDISIRSDLITPHFIGAPGILLMMCMQVPSASPTALPSTNPTRAPTAEPSTAPTSQPSDVPSGQPTTVCDRR